MLKMSTQEEREQNIIMNKKRSNTSVKSNPDSLDKAREDCCIA